jgi:Spy/CpxP family protein refolding chaperone
MMKMGKITVSAALVATLALGWQGRIWADEAPNSSSPTAAPEAMQGPGGGMRGEMKEKLGLSDEQAQKFGEEQKQNRETMKPLREKAKALLETLASQIKDKAADGEINSTISSLEGVRKDMEAARQSHAAALQSILTPSQYGQVVLFMAKQMVEAAGEMNGGGGGAPVSSNNDKN